MGASGSTIPPDLFRSLSDFLNFAFRGRSVVRESCGVSVTHLGSGGQLDRKVFCVCEPVGAVTFKSRMRKGWWYFLPTELAAWFCQVWVGLISPKSIKELASGTASTPVFIS